MKDKAEAGYTYDTVLTGANLVSPYIPNGYLLDTLEGLADIDMLNYLTEEEQAFFAEGVWDTLAEAYLVAKSIRKQEPANIRLSKLERLIHLKKLSIEHAHSLTNHEIEIFTHLTPFLIHFKMTVDDWIALQHMMKYAIESTSPRIQPCAILILTNKMHAFQTYMLRDADILRIKRLTALLIDKRLNLPLDQTLLTCSVLKRSFNLLTPDDIESIRMINWPLVTGFPFDPLPEDMSVEEILCATDEELNAHIKKSNLIELNFFPPSVPVARAIGAADVNAQAKKV